MTMKLALGLDLYRGASVQVPVEQVQRAEALGYHSVWTAEAYGSDAFSPQAYLAAFTRRIKLGTDNAQKPARAPPPPDQGPHCHSTSGSAGEIIEGERPVPGAVVTGPAREARWCADCCST